MRHGKPVALLRGVAGKSLETLLTDEAARAARPLPARHVYQALDVEVVGESLVAHGAPLAAWKGAAHLSLEDTVIAGLRLARENATVLRVLPILLAKNLARLEWPRLRQAAADAHDEAALGMLLELTSDVTGHPEFRVWSKSLPTPTASSPAWFLDGDRRRSASADYRDLLRRRTPRAARRWGFLMTPPSRTSATPWGSTLR